MVSPGRHAPVMLMLFLATGCGGRHTEIPPVFDVSGQVKLKNGKPYPGGMIEFRSLGKPGLTTLGVIQPDGTFSLHTLADSQKISGAPAGKYQVTIIPGKKERGVEAILLPQPFEVKSAGGNDLAITVDEPKPAKVKG